MTAEASTEDTVVTKVENPGMMSFCRTGAQDAYVGLPSSAAIVEQDARRQNVTKSLRTGNAA